MDEIKMEMLHRLARQLGALMLYLHETKRRIAHEPEEEGIQSSLRASVESALLELTRVFEIMERLGLSGEASLDAKVAVSPAAEIPNSDSPVSAVISHSNSLPKRDGLTPREREALNLIVGGASNKNGGIQMGISMRTFEAHRAHVMDKLGARNAADLVRKALGAGR